VLLQAEIVSDERPAPTPPARVLAGLLIACAIVGGFALTVTAGAAASHDASSANASAATQNSNGLSRLAQRSGAPATTGLTMTASPATANAADCEWLRARGMRGSSRVTEPAIAPAA
jgi:hypothetical protein